MANPPPSAAARPTAVLNYRGAALPARFGEPAAEYERVRTGAGLFDRADRGLLILTGADRKAWLHNLVTNAVRDLEAPAGVYAFALDVTGRIQFDLNILSGPGALWLDLDRAALPAARAHLERYHLSEDVQLREAHAEFARLGCAGPQAPEVAARLGVAQLSTWPALTCRPLTAALSSPLPGGTWLFRHDFAGLPGFELIVPRAAAAGTWDRLVAAGAAPAGFLILDALRVEAGIPWLGRDLDDRVLPLETGWATRGVNFQKGCYLGQEIVERMRARGALARRLVRLTLPPGPELVLPAELHAGHAVVGRVTSLVAHPVRSDRIGLGYLNTSVTDARAVTAGDPPMPVLATTG